MSKSKKTSDNGEFNDEALRALTRQSTIPPPTKTGLDEDEADSGLIDLKALALSHGASLDEIADSLADDAAPDAAESQDADEQPESVSEAPVVAAEEKSPATDAEVSQPAKAVAPAPVGAEEPAKSKMPLVLVAVAILGVGGAFAMQQGGDDAPAAAIAGEADNGRQQAVSPTPPAEEPAEEPVAEPVVAEEAAPSEEAAPAEELVAEAEAESAEDGAEGEAAQPAVETGSEAAESPSAPTERAVAEAPARNRDEAESAGREAAPAEPAVERNTEPAARAEAQPAAAAEPAPTPAAEREPPPSTERAQRASGGSSGDLNSMLDQALGGGAMAVPVAEMRATMEAAPAAEADRSANLPETPSRAAVSRALGGLMSGMRRCAGDQVGLATARIRVRNDGSIASASIVGSPFGGTPQGACMQNVVRRARLPRFRRPTFDVTFPFYIR